MTAAHDKSGAPLTQNKTAQPCSITDHISPEMLQAYLTAREKIDRQINQLLIYTNLLRQYKDCSGDEVLVEMYAIGEVNDRLHSQLLDITDELDDFLPVWEVMKVVNRDPTQPVKRE